ncbi:MAG: hypothetical protein WCG25_06875 [bacterium]
MYFLFILSIQYEIISKIGYICHNSFSVFISSLNSSILSFHRFFNNFSLGLNCIKFSFNFSLSISSIISLSSFISIDFFRLNKFFIQLFRLFSQLIKRTNKSISEIFSGKITQFFTKFSFISSF